MEQKIFPIPELPKNYEDNRIVLLVRDAHWLYAYWEISGEKKREISLAFGEDIWQKARLILKLHQIMPHYRIERNIFIHPLANNWYINAEEANCPYQVEIGLSLEENGFFVSLASSNKVQTPADNFSPITDEKWASVGTNYKIQENIIEQSGLFTNDYSSLQLFKQEENK